MYSRAHEEQRKQLETPERILYLAALKGEFCVSLRYRDDWLRQRCYRLRAVGFLTGGKRVRHGQIIFKPVRNLDLVF